MNVRTSLYATLFLLLIVAILHISGIRLYFYWRIGWYDKVVHMLAGAAVVFFMYYIIRTIDIFPRSYTLVLAMIAAILIGIGWEIFEIQSGYTSVHKLGYAFSTMADLLSDVIGGTAAVLYILQKQLS